jgi:hypothetical protein
VPLLTHLNLLCIHSVSHWLKRLPSPGTAILARAVFWRRRSRYGERRPSVQLTQIKATHAQLRMI